jgi:predicted ATPase
VCTAALAFYLGHALSSFLTGELERIRREGVYESQVFFIENLGHITPTSARRITFEESLQFEKVHEDTYRKFGFELLHIAPGNITERVRLIRAAVQSGNSDSGSGWL